ncbi:GTPase [Mariniblastus fucicola]|uniref:tRNA modification GTPase MnmE n=1 Tax=Mariniblastus fucicola TaxID=980251 RepID=A0A5B9P3P3_9BACT|nr:GTPase [Mariniblastus fucicola]QEG21207.1 tRNA modification GTPase MnmE [Mariniblastus fucicola]
MAVEFHELTHHGRGAISVVGVRGEGSDGVLDSCFAPVSGQSFSALKNRPIVYGIWNSTGEDLVVVRIGNDAFEIQCHGSLAAVDAIATDLAAGGAVQSSDAASWTLARNELQAEVAKAMESCLTQRTARHLLQQFQLWGEVNFNDPEIAREALLFTTFGEKLTSPWRIVLCGRPNVGKSSLINVLCGFERAIVHATAGTTRDLVSQHTAIDGWPVELVDSAGIRDEGNAIEQAGIEKARQLIADADLVIHVVDATDDSSFDPLLSQHRAGLVVVNKVDLCQQPAVPQTDCPRMLVSAVTGLGMDDLQAAISKAIVPVVPGDDQLVPVSTMQRRRLEQLA